MAVLLGMAAFPLLRNRDDGRPGGCRNCLSGVSEDLHGSLSSSAFHQIKKTGVGDKIDVLLSYIAAF